MQPKILLLDDDKDLLELYKEILAQLPSRPEIVTCSKGARAITMLEEEPFNLLISDLNMPKMDGLQVLSIVRRKFPQLRTIVLTSVLDEQFRSRAYSLGVDLFWHKPSNPGEITQLLECIESLLGRDDNGGFRGLQSKSLLDILQLECLSNNSTLLKITNGTATGRIWIHLGEVVDAQTDTATGEGAFRSILTWKSGNFESLTAEPDRPRTIFTPYQRLLLESAHAQDEAKDGTAFFGKPEGKSRLTPILRSPGVEFVLALRQGEADKFEARGLENAQPTAKWSRNTMERFRALGDELQAGPLLEIIGLGNEGHIVLAPHAGLDFCLGWDKDLPSAKVSESSRTALALWNS